MRDVDRFVQEQGDSNGGVPANENRDFWEWECEGRKERREGYKGRDQRPGRKRGLIVARHVANRIRATDGLLRIIKADRGQLVVREVTRGKGAEEPHGLDMEQIAVEEIFSKADNKIADEARKADRPDARWHVLVPGWSEEIPHNRKERDQLQGDEYRKPQGRGWVLGPSLKWEEV